MDKHRDRMARGRQQRERFERARAQAELESEMGSGMNADDFDDDDDLSQLRSHWGSKSFAGHEGFFKPRTNEICSFLGTPFGDTPQYPKSPFSSLSPWASSSVLSLNQTLPAREFAALDPSKHSLDTPDAFRRSDRFDKRANASSRLQQQLQLWEPDRGGKHRRQPLQAEPDSCWDSWEAKWARLLEAEAAVEHAEDEKRRVVRQRMEEAERRLAQAAQDAAIKSAAKLREAKKQSEQWSQRQQTGHEEFEKQRSRWRQQEEQKKQSEPQWWEKGGEPRPGPRPRAAQQAPAKPAPAVAATPSKPAAPAERQFASWAEYCTGWDTFEVQLAKGSAKVAYADIPWPNMPGGSVVGIVAGLAAAETKKRLFAALRRWHPDKWQSVLDRVPEKDLNLVRRRVKEVTEQILDEKRRAGL